MKTRKKYYLRECVCGIRDLRFVIYDCIMSSASKVNNGKEKYRVVKLKTINIGNLQ